MELFNVVTEIYKKILNTQRTKILELAKTAKGQIEKGGVIFVYGSGHSMILVEEAFHRAGGLVPVVPILQTFLSPHTPPKISGKIERLSGVAEILFERYKPTTNDLMFIVSNSGVNASTVEMAEICKTQGVKSIAITSLLHSTAAKSRHKSGKKLFEIVDITIDNHTPEGDGLFDISGTKVCAASTLANVFIWNQFVYDLVNMFEKEGKTLPVYRSSNLPGHDQVNENLEKQYRDRNPLL